MVNPEHRADGLFVWCVAGMRIPKVFSFIRVMLLHCEGERRHTIYVYVCVCVCERERGGESVREEKREERDRCEV
jgi:hypothetical protein